MDDFELESDKDSVDSNWQNQQDSNSSQDDDSQSDDDSTTRKLTGPDKKQTIEKPKWFQVRILAGQVSNHNFQKVKRRSD